MVLPKIKGSTVITKVFILPLFPSSSITAVAVSRTSLMRIISRDQRAVTSSRHSAPFLFHMMGPVASSRHPGPFLHCIRWKERLCRPTKQISCPDIFLSSTHHFHCSLKYFHLHNVPHNPRSLKTSLNYILDSFILFPSLTSSHHALLVLQSRRHRHLYCSSNACFAPYSSEAYQLPSWT